MKMKFKIDPKLEKIGLAAIGMMFTALGSMITNNIQQRDQKETMTKIAKEVFMEELTKSGKGV